MKFILIILFSYLSYSSAIIKFESVTFSKTATVPIFNRNLSIFNVLTIYSIEQPINVTFNSKKFINITQISLLYNGEFSDSTFIVNTNVVNHSIWYFNLEYPIVVPGGCKLNPNATIAISPNEKSYQWLYQLEYKVAKDFNIPFNTCSQMAYRLYYFPINPQNNFKRYSNIDRNSFIQEFIKMFSSDIKSFNNFYNYTNINLSTDSIDFSIYKRVGYSGVFLLHVTYNSSSYSYPPWLTFNTDAASQYTYMTRALLITALTLSSFYFFIGQYFVPLQIIYNTWIISTFVSAMINYPDFLDLSKQYWLQYPDLYWFIWTVFIIGPIIAIVITTLIMKVTAKENRLRIIFAALVNTYIVVSLLWFIMMCIRIDETISISLTIVFSLIGFLVLVICNNFTSSYGSILTCVTLIVLCSSHLWSPTTVIQYLFIDLYYYLKNTASYNWIRINFVTENDVIMMAVWVVVFIIFGTCYYRCIKKKKNKSKKNVSKKSFEDSNIFQSPVAFYGTTNVVPYQRDGSYSSASTSNATNGRPLGPNFYPLPPSYQDIDKNPSAVAFNNANAPTLQTYHNNPYSS